MLSSAGSFPEIEGTAGVRDLRKGLQQNGHGKKFLDDIRRKRFLVPGVERPSKCYWTKILLSLPSKACTVSISLSKGEQLSFFKTTTGNHRLCTTDDYLLDLILRLFQVRDTKSVAAVKLA